MQNTSKRISIVLRKFIFDINYLCSLIWFLEIMLCDYILNTPLKQNRFFILISYVFRWIWNALYMRIRGISFRIIVVIFLGVKRSQIIKRGLIRELTAKSNTNKHFISWKQISWCRYSIYRKTMYYILRAYSPILKNSTFISLSINKK